MSSPKLARFLIASVMMLAVGVALMLAMPIAHAAGAIYVDRTDDPTVTTRGIGAVNDCSLRGASLYANANPGTEIVLTHGAIYTLSILKSGGEYAVDGDLNINANATIDYGNIICVSNCIATIQGGAGWNDRIFYIANGVTVQISGVTIRNGNTSDLGGGIYNGGNLTLRSVTVRDNTAVNNGGGIQNDGTLTITGGAILSNTVTSTNDGGGLGTSGTTTISDASIAYNSAYDGGGIDQFSGS